ncbi:tetratricopeptide repeat protein [Paenibacillus andongensis]|uniref:tetratricopeptide repeat protein n=1 Tax=Paenibacillus andongensis TaxID=2975482 RepID=UPI0021BAC805|nr:tetratricopeptide repeat protein [Paenibacillus andongensis]
MSLYNQGDDLYAEGKYREAYGYFLQSYTINVDVTDSMNYLGCCELTLGNYEAALDWFNRLSKLEPTWERPITNIGRVYLMQGRFTEAYDQFKKAIK